MHNPLSALFEIARRFLPAGADVHLVQAEEHLRDAIRAEVKAEIEAQLEPGVERLLSAVRTALSPAPIPPVAPAAPTSTGSSDPLQASSPAPSAA